MSLVQTALTPSCELTRIIETIQDFVDGLKNSISSLEVTADDVEAVVGRHLDLSSHPYFGASLNEAISDAIAAEAKTQVDTAKQAVLTELDSLAVTCASARRLGGGAMAEVSPDGSQRKLSVDLTFDALVEVSSSIYPRHFRRAL